MRQKPEPEFLLSPGLILILLCMISAKRCPGQPPPNHLQNASDLMQTMSSEQPDPCLAPAKENTKWTNTEDSLFTEVANYVKQELNSSSPYSVHANERAKSAIDKIMQASAALNAAWPDENRFHYELHDYKTALILVLTFQTQARYFFSAIPETFQNKTNKMWQEIGYDGNSLDHSAPRSWRKIFDLKKSPSGHTRFLVRSGYTGCAGSSGLAYSAFEWIPDGDGSLEKIIHQEGASGMDEDPVGTKPSPKHPFPPAGSLQTKGSRITLPFCWFSAIDSWDNPSLCAVDTYDLSGNTVSFGSRTYNRPDLVPVAKAIEYAGKRDYEAVLGYCATSEIAKQMVRQIEPFVFAGALEIKQIRPTRERVEVGDPGAYRFDVAKQRNRWVITGFKVP